MDQLRRRCARRDGHRRHRAQRRDQHADHRRCADALDVRAHDVRPAPSDHRHPPCGVGCGRKCRACARQHASGPCTNYWLVQRGVDNGPDPNENDGKIFELSVGQAGNAPPVVDSAVIDQSAPKTNDTLTVSATAHDPDGDPITLRYEWRLDGVQIAGQTTSTLDLSLAGNGDKGDAISVRVAAFDGISEGAPRTSAQVSIENTAPVFGADLPNRTDLEGAAVSVSAGATDADGDPLTYEATGLPAGITLNATNGLLEWQIATGTPRPRARTAFRSRYGRAQSPTPSTASRGR